MKQRTWKDDAWELCRQHNYPGCVALVEKAMEFGYRLGLKDATGEFREAIDHVKETKERSNAPR